jgi:uncharacterized protein YfaS (alpha-2-macroglobulin family)
MDRRSPKEDHFSSAAKSFGGEFEATPSLGRTSGQVPSVMRTLYWNPELQTDSEGKAEIVFDLPDATRPFHVVIDATDDQGRIGSLRFQVPPDETASAAESSP